MREDLKRIVDQLNEEDLYLLYVAALELIRDYPEEHRRGQGAAFRYHQEATAATPPNVGTSKEAKE